MICSPSGPLLLNNYSMLSLHTCIVLMHTACILGMDLMVLVWKHLNHPDDLSLIMSTVYIYHMQTGKTLPELTLREGRKANLWLFIILIYCIINMHFHIQKILSNYWKIPFILFKEEWWTKIQYLDQWYTMT